MTHIAPADIIADDDAARSVRNAERLRDLASARRMAMNMMARLTSHDGLPDPIAADTVKDPYLTMSRLQLGLCRIVALEQRLDESEEMRERRLIQEEAERQAKAEKAAQDAARTERLAANAVIRQKVEAEQAAIRKAVRDASFDMDAMMSIAERENLIDGLFTDFDTYKDYGGDPAAIVMELCCDLANEMGIKDPLEPGGLTDLPDDATVEQRYEAMKALAQSYLDGDAPYPPEPSAARREPAESG